MRVLLIHTFYTQRGGEDAVFEQESALLQEEHKVRTLTFQNLGGIRGALQFLSSIWNIASAWKLKKAIAQHRPDIIHIHNLHFAAGPLLIRVAKKKNIPVVITLHNYRMICPSGTFLHCGKLFTQSLHESFPFTAVRKKVYRNSYLQTFWLAFVNWFHKKIGTWNMPDQYLLFTAFSHTIWQKASLNILSDKFSIKPNFGSSIPFFYSTHNKAFLFIGRLSEEKGLDTLTDAFLQTNHQLRIAGSGPSQQIVAQAAQQHKNIEYLGMLNKQQLQHEIQNATALVFTSICFEGMPMSIIEAFASGLPVIASNLGAMSSMIQDGYNGLLFEPGNAMDLQAKLNYWSQLTPEAKKVFSNNARQTFEEHYTPEKNLDTLTAIYHSVLSHATPA